MFINKLDLILLSALMALWGFNFSIIKLGVNNIDPLVLTALRFSFAVFPMIFFIKKPNVAWHYLISYGLTFGVGVWGLTTLSIDFGLSAGMASLLLDMSVLSSLLIGWLILNEKISLNKLIGAGVASMGLLLIIFSNEGSISIPGVILVLVASCFWSINGVIVKKANTKSVFAFNIWAMLFAPIPMLLLSWLFHGSESITNSLLEINRNALISVLFQAYPTTLLGYWLWNKFIIKYSLSSVAPFTLLVPVFGILGGFLFYNEEIISAQIVAAILILLGLFISQQNKPLFKINLAPQR